MERSGHNNFVTRNVSVGLLPSIARHLRARESPQAYVSFSGFSYVTR
jgi:hypothetical protein